MQIRLTKDMYTPFIFQQWCLLFFQLITLHNEYKIYRLNRLYRSCLSNSASGAEYNQSHVNHAECKLYMGILKCTIAQLVLQYCTCTWLHEKGNHEFCHIHVKIE
jgi:hypothetical protein